jgi:hypothetical protein
MTQTGVFRSESSLSAPDCLRRKSPLMTVVLMDGYPSKEPGVELFFAEKDRYTISAI